MPVANDPRLADTVIKLEAEQIEVSRRTITGDTVRLDIVTHETTQPIETMLSEQRIDIRTVPIGRVVETMPPTRVEGDVTIFPVVEEILVTERRLLLKEEIHVRRIVTTEPYRDSVMLRRQEAIVSRAEAPPASGQKTESTQ